MLLKTFEKFEIVDAINEDNGENLIEIKNKIYKKAKEDYMHAVAKELKAHGVKVEKMYIDDDDEPDNFSNCTFDCSYKGKSFHMKMSNRGVSLAPGLKNISGQYSTKVAQMVKKIEKAI